MIERETEAVRINLASSLVDDQDKALEFYTDTLGFVKKTDSPARRGALANRRLTRGAGGDRARARAGRAPGGEAVQAGASRRWHPLYVVCRR
jgi:catechol 2,3-dioxygenase-like lactoylglutathione lyase family enzyme